MSYSSSQLNLLTIDVEDNFTYEELKDKNDWQVYERQVVENTRKILKILSAYKTTATFFIVGKVAERHPYLVQEIEKKGHEIASHTYLHEPYRLMPLDEVRNDVQKSIKILNSLSKRPVIGFRAMGFSLPEDAQRFMRILVENDLVYDASGKYAPKNATVYEMNFEGHGIYQIFPSTLRVKPLRSRIVFSGGTYLRLLPCRLIDKGFAEYKKNEQPVLIYIHPWEFNRDQPKRRVNIKQRILQSPLSYSTEGKLIRLLKEYNFASISQFLDM